MKLFKRLTCGHEKLNFVKNIGGDEINHLIEFSIENL